MNIYVGRLPYAVNESQLEELFAQYGPVTSVKVIKDKFTGNSRGFAFVQMGTEEGAKAIAELNDYELDGRKIIVNEARESEGPRPGGNGGGSFQNRGPRPGGNRFRS